MKKILMFGLFCIYGFGLMGCATTSDIEGLQSDIQRLEGKIDQLVHATDRSTLEAIFGVQAAEIQDKIGNLDVNQQEGFQELKTNYERGLVSLADVREQMMSILGGDTREVSTKSGVYIRNQEGVKTKAISNGTKISACRLMKDAEIPEFIKDKAVLKKFSWGIGSIEGETIIFPWDLTISSFAKEIVERTAKRTAEEFIRMGGEKKWSRPINIQVTTEKNDKVNITTDDPDSEVYVIPPDE